MNHKLAIGLMFKQCLGGYVRIDTYKYLPETYNAGVMAQILHLNTILHKILMIVFLIIKYE